jgi:hypothetical protein
VKIEDALNGRSVEECEADFNFLLNTSLVDDSKLEQTDNNLGKTENNYENIQLEGIDRIGKQPNHDVDLSMNESNFNLEEVQIYREVTSSDNYTDREHETEPLLISEQVIAIQTQDSLILKYELKIQIFFKDCYIVKKSTT